MTIARDKDIASTVVAAQGHTCPGALITDPEMAQVRKDIRRGDSEQPERQRATAQGGDSPLVIALQPGTKRFTIVVMCLLMLFTTIEFGAPGLVGKQPAFVDFHVFHLVADYISRGELAQAYDFGAFQAHQGWLNPADDAFMPWSYPPQFNLLLAMLAPFDLWLAYLLFTAATLGAFMLVLRKLAGPHFFAVLVFMLPAFFVTIRSGQNGFLTASLIGLFCLLSLGNHRAAGVPLGLMAIKPHLVVGLALVVLLRRKAAVLAVAAAVTVAAALGATLAFGVDIWGAVARSAAQTSAYLHEGRYPLFRMTSVYAWLRSWGLPTDTALAAQVVAALVALGGVVWVHVRRWQTRRVLGATVLASFMVSPYNYDYDLCSLAIAVALFMPDVAKYASRGEQVALAVATWLATGAGLIMYAVPEGAKLKLEAWAGVGTMPSVGAIFYLAVTALLLRLAAEGQRQLRADFDLPQ